MVGPPCSSLSLSLSLSVYVAMLCWGKAEEGALGLGGIEEMVVPQPTRNRHLGDRGVRRVGMLGVAAAVDHW